LSLYSPNQHKVPFKVHRVSTNTNAFGQNGIILVGMDGTAWEVCRIQCGHRTPWTEGTIVDVPHKKEAPLWHLMDGVECPRQLQKLPAKLVNEVWKKKSKE